MMPPEELRAMAPKAQVAHQIAHRVAHPVTHPVAHQGGAAEDTVEASLCRPCARVHAPARSYRCLGCGSSDLQPTRIPLRGVLETFTVVKGAAEGLALVRLEAGPRLTVQLVVGGDAQPTLGARVVGVQVRGGATGEPKVCFRFALVPLPARTLLERRPESKTS